MYKYYSQYDAANYTKATDSASVFGHNRVVRGITIHHWGDPALAYSFNGVISDLCNNRRNVSAHYVVQNREVACIVDPDDVAWHSGNAYGNATTVGIECHPRASKGDIATVVELVADLRFVYGDVMLYAHNYWQNTQCPGRYDVFQIDRDSYKVLKTKYGISF